MNRTAGILLSVSSLPSKYGIGCFSKSAYEFADWLKEAGQSYWQILPLGPTSYGDSPYQSFSTYAGNPYFISLEDLIEEGVLTEKECEKLETESKEGTIDYKKLYEDRYPILRKAYERSNISENPDYQQFLAENEWWLKRLSHCFKLYDAVRIDHFRGFDQYYSIPYGAEDATRGHWEQGPGIDLFNRVRQVLGEKEVIAEDLGYVTDSVRKLVYDSGFPGMKVLEFAFDSRDSGCANDYLPHNYPENSVAYTGTHDNETLAGWFDSITKEEQNMVRDYLCDHYTPKKYLYKSLNSLVMRSKAALCVIPMQDYLGLDNHYRMNKPSTVGENWKWRLKKGELTDLLKEEIRGMTRRYGRLNGQ